MIGSDKPFMINGPTAISFSGGRTSAYMLWRTVQANGGIPDDCFILFANTGMEMPETLDFVRDVAENWNLPITWLELGEYVQNGVYKSGSKEGLPRWKAETRVVDWETASRNGEPFKRLCLKRKYLPNIMSRFCTAELKVRRIRDFLKNNSNVDSDDDWTQFIGIRGDEPRRAAKIHNKIDEGHLMWSPLFLDQVTKEEVGAFWQAQDFDLALPMNNGVTDFGNCSLCFLKGYRKKLSIIRQRPDLADWWIEMEALMGTSAGTAARFRGDQPSYAEMKIIATSTEDMFADDNFADDTIPCFCEDA